MELLLENIACLSKLVNDWRHNKHLSNGSHASVFQNFRKSISGKYIIILKSLLPNVDSSKHILKRRAAAYGTEVMGWVCTIKTVSSQGEMMMLYFLILQIKKIVKLSLVGLFTAPTFCSLRTAFWLVPEPSKHLLVILLAAFLVVLKTGLSQMQHEIYYCFPTFPIITCVYMSAYT